VAAQGLCAQFSGTHTADNPGVWLFQCHVNDHIAAGMLTRYQGVP
jgi:FtsP/CotA-like multicopper oxidase with cupredoxin domain